MPTENFYLFELSEDRKTTVGILLTGETIPLQNMEYELLKTMNLVKARLDKQKGN